MTTIIFKETPKGVKIGFDSQVTTGWRKGELAYDKVFVNNGVIYGVAGAVRDANILKYGNLPEIPDEEWDVDKWVTTELIPAIMGILQAQGALESQNGQASSDSLLLVAVRGRVYRIGSYFSWLRHPDGLYAIGSGSDYAQGALVAGASVSRSLEIAASLDSYTGQTLKLTTGAALLRGE